MDNKKIKYMVIITAFILLLSGGILYYVFDKQGMSNHKTNNYVNYNVNDYVEITPVMFNNYDDVYSNINVSRIDFKNIDGNLVKDFIYNQKEIIEYVDGYYSEIASNDLYNISSSVSSGIKVQMNGAVLSVLYRMDFVLDDSIFSDNYKTYFTAINIDLATNKVLTKEDLLMKYNYTKSYIADKLFNEDVLIEKNQVVIDKNTNMSLTKNDIERKKEVYVNRIISEFENIIDMYIEDGSLVLMYDSKELKNIFYDNEFNTNIKIRYLK